MLEPRRQRVHSGAIHRTGAPVLRDSLEEGTFEDEFFIAPAPHEADRMKEAAQALLKESLLQRRRQRQGEPLSASQRLVAQLTAAMLSIYNEICDMAWNLRGKVYPSYAYLAEQSGRAYSTVGKAIRVLVELGLLVKQRRFKRVVRKEPGPRYEQTSNAYRPMLSRLLLKMLPRRFRPAPLPADEIQREADRRDEMDLMLSQLTARERRRLEISSGPLADALDQFAMAIDARERESEDRA